MMQEKKILEWPNIKPTCYMQLAGWMAKNIFLSGFPFTWAYGPTDMNTTEIMECIGIKNMSLFYDSISLQSRNLFTKYIDELWSQTMFSPGFIL